MLFGVLCNRMACLTILQDLKYGFTYSCDPGTGKWFIVAIVMVKELVSVLATEMGNIKIMVTGCLLRRQYQLLVA